MKLAVVGSRDLRADVGPFIDLYPNVSLIISGGARGIDRAAERYAAERGIPVRVILPDYQAFGKGAPLIRDRQIVDEADAVLAIWDGVSRGTAYTMNYAKKKGKPLRVFQYREVSPE